MTGQVIVSRLSDLGGDKMAFSTVTGIFATVQPLTDSKSAIANGVFGKTFVLYTDGRVSLYQGDRLRDDDNNFYTVKSGGVTRRQFGRMSFTKTIIELTF